ncbi:MAG: PAS domain S-box protein [Anaerolineaceae bacterium]|nr:PAS domain S-box protein [Anaerolineaceae bacterium]
MNLFIELIHNISLLFALTFVYSLIIPRANQLNSLTKNILQGTAFGCFGVLALASAIPVADGFIVDGRYVIVVITSVFAGGIPTLIAAIMMIIYRFILGGAGAVPAAAAMTVAVAISLLSYRQRKQSSSHHHLGSFLILGMIIAAQSLLWIALLGGKGSLQIVGAIAPPLLILTPVGTVLLGSLLNYQQQQFKMSDALRESEERYRVVVTSLNEGIILQSAKGDVRTSNPAAEVVLGLTADQIEGREPAPPKWEALHPDGSPFLREDHASMVALRTGQPQSNIIMGIHKVDGTLTWISVHSKPLFAKGSKTPYAALTTFMDITEVRKAQEKLRQERDLLRTLIDSTPDYIFLKDADGRFILTNTAHARAAGNINPHDLIGKTAFDVFLPELATQFHEDDQKIMQSGEALINAERETVDAQGNRKFVLTTKIPWRDKDGQILGLVGISRDVTERKQLESQTAMLSAEKERVRVLHRFITDMSHDFRTPLSIINSSTYLLRRITDAAKRDEKLKSIEEQSDRMLKLLDDLLEMGRLDETDFKYQFTKEVINTLVQTIANDFQAAATLKHQTLTFVPDPDLPITQIDALRFSRAVIHLVQNAINYTPANGTITLHTFREDEVAALSVTDTGIGIDEEDLTHIFERFYRADGARNNSTGGSGLGLPIVKKIIEAHDGSINVESIVNKGSTFTIKLPMSANEPEKTI